MIDYVLSNSKKLELYNILNGIRSSKYVMNVPYSFINPSIKLTYKEIKLKYITNKNYFVKVTKSNNQHSPNNQNYNNQHSPNNQNYNNQNKPNNQNYNNQHSPNNQNKPNNQHYNNQHSPKHQNYNNQHYNNQHKPNNQNYNNQHYNNQHYNNQHYNNQHKPNNQKTNHDIVHDNVKKLDILDKKKYNTLGGFIKTPIYVYC